MKEPNHELLQLSLPKSLRNGRDSIPTPSSSSYLAEWETGWQVVSQAVVGHIGKRVA